jgi:hypothetical protein
MSFEEHPDCFIWRCNGKGCGKEVIFPPTDFWGCVAELKSRQWSFYRDEETGDWTHHCGRCVYKHRQTDWMDRTYSKPREVKG